MVTLKGATEVDTQLSERLSAGGGGIRRKQEERVPLRAAVFGSGDGFLDDLPVDELTCWLCLGQGEELVERQEPPGCRPDSHEHSIRDLERQAAQPDDPLERGDLARVPGEVLMETIARSINTSFVVLLTVVAMLLIGGVTIRNFLLVLLVGILAGTYSSIAVAAQVLVVWHNNDIGRFWRKLTGRGNKQETPALEPA